LTTPGLTDVLERQFGSDAAQRWTYKSGVQLDYVLVSTPLAAAIRAAGVERRGVYGGPARDGTAGTAQPFAIVTSPTTAASDHGAVWAALGVGPSNSRQRRASRRVTR